MSEKYPEHVKLKAKEREAALIGDFLDFVSDQGWEIAELGDDSDYFFPIRKRNEEIIGLFLEIDPKKLEAEKRAMLAELRKQNDAQQRAQP